MLTLACPAVAIAKTVERFDKLVAAEGRNRRAQGKDVELRQGFSFEKTDL